MSRQKALLQTTVLLLSSVFLSGCASLFGNKHDIVAVQSSRPGLEVFHKNKSQGKAPAFVLLEKSYETKEISLLDSSKKVVGTLKAEPHYQWLKNLGENIWLLSAAPFGMLTDALTGAGFGYSPSYKWGEGRAALSLRRLAVAPPLVPDETVSLGLGPKLEQFLRASYSQAEVVPFSKSVSQFYDQAYDFAQEQDWLGLRPALYNLRADAYLHSYVKETSPQGADVSYQLISSYSGELIAEGEVTYAKSEVPALEKSGLGSHASDWFTLIPNTLTIDWASPSIFLIDEGNNEIEASAVGVGGPFGRALHLLSALGWRYLEKPPSYSRSGWSLNFVPFLFASYNKWEINGSQNLDPVEFQQAGFAAGYGPQLNYRFWKTTIYFTVAGVAQYDRISGVGPENQAVAESVDFSTGSEFGIFTYINDRWSLRFFTRGVSQNEEAWEQFLSSTQKESIQLSSTSYNYGGFSIGYYIPWSKNPAKSVVELRDSFHPQPQVQNHPRHPNQSLASRWSKSSSTDNN